MSEISSFTHRDVVCKNKANAAVQGCIYADLNHSCIDTLKKNATNKLPEKMSDEQVLKLLDIAHDSNQKAKHFLLNSQSSISKRHCSNYATSQFKQLQAMAKNNEDINNVSTISPYIVDDNMIDMTKRMVHTRSNNMEPGE